MGSSTSAANGVESRSSRTLELLNPATEAAFATVSLGGAEDVDRAVKAARDAFPSFSLSGSSRLAPMGRYKPSGNGREMGVFSLEEYLEVKAMLAFPQPELASERVRRRE